MANPPRYKLKECSGNKTLTPKVYVTVSKWLSDLWGPNAGWAHSLLFDAKLKTKRTKSGGGKAAASGAKEKREKKKQRS